MISLSLNLKIMTSGHIIFGQSYFFENMIFRADIKSLPGYGYKRDLGLRCRLVDVQVVKRIKTKLWVPV